MNSGIIHALADWNPWWETGQVPLELKGIQRSYTNELITLAEEREVKILTGVRRSGKSTLFYQVIDWLLSVKNIPPQQILLVNFEDSSLEKAGIEGIFEAYQTSFGLQASSWVFLDEVNRQQQWERWVRKWYDLKRNLHFFVTGSSAHFLKEEFATLLTGRNFTVEIYPLSFKEFLMFSAVELPPLHALSTSAANNLKYHFNQYLKSSGFPEAFAKKNTIYRLLLNQYFEDILYKDIVARHGANYQKLKDIALYLLTNHANLFSLRTVRGWLEMGINTISEYVGYLEDAWLIFQSSKYHFSYKKQLVNPKKIYAIDIGLRNVVSFRFSEDLGRDLENLVAIELKRRGKEFYYWKNSRGAETDFLVHEGAKITSAFQVCAKLDDPKIRQREIAGLLAAMHEFNLKEGLILTLDETAVEKIDNKIIHLQPIWQWLLM